jgi:hypothetical protein
VLNFEAKVRGLRVRKRDVVLGGYNRFYIIVHKRSPGVLRMLRMLRILRL